MKEEQLTAIMGECLIDSDNEMKLGNGPILMVGYDELEAMRTPITAASIEAHGWHESYKTDQYGGLWEFSPPEKFDNTCLWAYSVECCLDGSLKRVVDSRNRTVPGAKTMHDIRELERLLGGS